MYSHGPAKPSPPARAGFGRRESDMVLSATKWSESQAAASGRPETRNWSGDSDTSTVVQTESSSLLGIQLVPPQDDPLIRSQPLLVTGLLVDSLAVPESAGSSVPGDQVCELSAGVESEPDW
jgi:hypothetical protein